MAQTQPYEPAAQPSDAWAGWITFAAVVLTLGTCMKPVYPVWSAIMILLDVVVIFALTARWSEARAAM